jgi:hypothetical protein
VRKSWEQSLVQYEEDTMGYRSEDMKKNQFHCDKIKFKILNIHVVKSYQIIIIKLKYAVNMYRLFFDTWYLSHN